MNNCWRPRIGVLIPSDLRKGVPSFGGNVGFLYSLLPHFPLSVLVCGFEADAAIPELPSLGDHVKFLSVGRCRFPSRIPVRLKSLYWYWRRRQQILKSVDVIYSHQIESTLPFLFGRHRVPVVFHQHEPSNPAGVSRFRWGRLPIFKAFFDLALRLIHRRATWIIAVDEASVRLAEQRGAGDRVSLLRNCVDDVSFCPSTEMRRRGRSEFGLNDSDRVILVSGRLNAAKRVDLAIRAFASLACSDSTLQLLIAGAGSEAGALNQLCSELGVTKRVMFLGHVMHSEMAKIYNTADLLLLTSEKEGSPMVVLEAIATGAPVIASRVGDIPEIINKDNGFILGSSSPSEIAATIPRCLARAWDRDSVAATVYGFSAEVVGRQISDLLLNVWQERDPRHLGRQWISGTQHDALSASDASMTDAYTRRASAHPGKSPFVEGHLEDQGSAKLGMAQGPLRL